MKNDLKQQARELFFESGLNKTQIAERLGINRRTIMLWCREGNWERLRVSAQHLPSIVAEKCYYLLSQYADSFFIQGCYSTFSHQHADAINKLASAIKKLRNRSTANESMEMFNYFCAGLHKKDPELAAMVRPHIEDYIHARRQVTVLDFLPPGFDESANMPFPTEEMDEEIRDEKDAKAFDEELAAVGNDVELALRNWQNPKDPGAAGSAEPPSPQQPSPAPFTPTAGATP